MFLKLFEHWMKIHLMKEDHADQLMWLCCDECQPWSVSINICFSAWEAIIIFPACPLAKIFGNLALFRYIMRMSSTIIQMFIMKGIWN